MWCVRATTRMYAIRAKGKETYITDDANIGHFECRAEISAEVTDEAVGLVVADGNWHFELALDVWHVSTLKTQ